MISAAFTAIFYSIFWCHQGYLFQDKNTYATLNNYLNEVSQYDPILVLNIKPCYGTK